MNMIIVDIRMGRFEQSQSIGITYHSDSAEPIQKNIVVIYQHFKSICSDSKTFHVITKLYVLYEATELEHNEIIHNPKVFSYRRVSKKQQVTQSGLKRQADAAQVWCNQNGYVLDKELDDKGLSGWTGENVDKGELGHFIAAAQHGFVPAGSILLVENIDRLSRKKVPDAMRQFLALTGLGIEIITLIDEKRYSDQSIGENGFELMYSLIEMIRANNESEVKSERVTDGKKAKFENARTNQVVAHGSPPRWLDFKKKGKEKHYSLNEHADTVRLIFDMCINGNGANAIMKHLNTEGIQRPCGHVQRAHVGNWTASSINNILKNVAVHGELRSKHADREPIPDYYPPVITKETFLQAQAAIKSRQQHRSKTATMNNLFSGLAKCAICGGNLSCNSKRPPKAQNKDITQTYGFTYYCNRQANHLSKCGKRSNWAYPLEKAILETVPVLDHTVTTKTDPRPAIKQQIIELEQQQERITDLIITDPDAPKILVQKLKDIEAKVIVLKQDIIEADTEFNKPAPTINYDINDIEKILDRSNKDLRRRTLENLKHVIKQIELYDNHAGTHDLTVIRLHNNKSYVLAHDRNDYSNVEIYHGTIEGYSQKLGIWIPEVA